MTSVVTVEPFVFLEIQVRADDGCADEDDPDR